MGLGCDAKDCWNKPPFWLQVVVAASGAPGQQQQQQTFVTCPAQLVDFTAGDPVLQGTESLLKASAEILQTAQADTHSLQTPWMCYTACDNVVGGVGVGPGGRRDAVNIRRRNLQKVWLVHVLNHHSTVLKTSWSIKWQRGMYKTRPCFLKRPFTDQRGRIYRAQNLQKVWLVLILNLCGTILKTCWSIDPSNDSELGTKLTHAFQRGHSQAKRGGG